RRQRQIGIRDRNNTVQAALDIDRYYSPDPYAGVADKELLAFDGPDLDMFHPADVSADEAIEQAARAG
ncbi:hypothetical protein Q2353_26080, partial [Escherichia coli]|nr:hypothetical protein [Escherichia coli]